eukprot:19901-Heterococcus_DN1.PRE.2
MQRDVSGGHDQHSVRRTLEADEIANGPTMQTRLAPRNHNALQSVHDRLFSHGAYAIGGCVLTTRTGYAEPLCADAATVTLGDTTQLDAIDVLAVLHLWHKRYIKQCDVLSRYTSTAHAGCANCVRRKLKLHIVLAAAVYRLRYHVQAAQSTGVLMVATTIPHTVLRVLSDLLSEQMPLHC